jgi:hypothetical protein
MWNLRSTAPHVVTASVCLVSTLIIGGARAQTATEVSDSKRVQVLQLRETSATKESLVKKSKSAATPAKKKIVQQGTVRQTKAAANETATSAQDDTSTLSNEQTGTLAIGDRAVAFASSPGEDNNAALFVANMGTMEDQSASALAIGNPQPAVANAEQPRRSQMAGWQASSSPLSEWLATLSGAMLAAAIGLYLVNSSRSRGISRRGGS